MISDGLLLEKDRALFQTSLLEISVSYGWVPEAECVLYSHFSNLALYEALKCRYGISEYLILKVVAEKLGMAFRFLSDVVVDDAYFGLFDPSDMVRLRFLPVYADDVVACVAVCCPFDADILDTIREKAGGMRVQWLVMPEADLLAGVASLQSGEDSSLLDRLIETAIERRASDIHISRFPAYGSVYFRVDGALVEGATFSPAMTDRLGMMIKIRSEMDLGVYYTPQDGRFTFSGGGKSQDIRVSSLPTVDGEDFVCRLLSSSEAKIRPLTELGFLPEARDMVARWMRHASGLVLVTGPTGSGKSTTLYTLLSLVAAQKDRMIVSLEDPVELVMPGIRQSPIRRQAGYDFPRALRAALRQDPDVIVLGEIRDSETAQTAIEAAYTGHLVIATLHTQTVKSSLTRLTQLGVDSGMAASCLLGIVSQRLLPRLCPVCRSPEAPETEWVGCSTCSYRGFSGRVVVTECGEFSGADGLDALSGSYLSFESDLQEKVRLGWVAAMERGAW